MVKDKYGTDNTKFRSSLFVSGGKKGEYNQEEIY